MLKTAVPKVLSFMAVLAFTVGPAVASNKEHPEHPEHPEKKGGKKASAVQLEQVAKFAEDYVAKKSKNGVFRYYDRKTKKWLDLTLDKVHRDRLCQTRKDEYFVCADFKGADGTLYDLDLFVRGKDAKKLKVDKRSITVHKVNGKPLYNWSYDKKKEVWVKSSAMKEGKGSGKEHPEHPK